MGKPPRKRRLSGEARRALELVSRSPDGVNEALLLAHGFTRQMLTGFVRSGLATWHHRTVRAGGRTIDVNYMMITAAGEGRSRNEGNPHMNAQTFRELTYTMRPQDPHGDGTGLRFETGEHGGDYPR
jgi:hypothetical protein